MEPMLNVASSGLRAGTTLTLSSAVIYIVPPVVTQTIASVLALMRVAIWRYTSGSVVGLPVSGSLAWTCIEAAPASAARTASSAISSGVKGK
jgi:hypothetical protein